MKLTLPKEVLRSLPAPDEEGLVRVMVSMRVNADDGTANIEQVDGKPVGDDSDDPAEPEATDDAAPMTEPPPLDPSKMY